MCQRKLSHQVSRFVIIDPNPPECGQCFSNRPRPTSKPMDLSLAVDQITPTRSLQHVKGLYLVPLFGTLGTLATVTSSGLSDFHQRTQERESDTFRERKQ